MSPLFRPAYAGPFYLRGIAVKRCTHYLVLVLALLLAPVARAGLPAPDALYSASVPVINQGDEERRRALREGFLQVLVRVSGQSTVAGNTVIQQALTTIEKNLVEFSYSPLGEAEKASLKASLEAEQKRLLRSKNQSRLLPVQVPTHRIQARFSPDAIHNLLDRAGLPFWPAQRPSVLVWTVVEDGQGLKPLSQWPQEQKYFREEAQRRGLALVWPMQDLTDQLALPAERLVSLDAAAVREASARYGEAAVLAGRLRQVSASEWQANWMFLAADGAVMFDASAEDLPSLLAAGVEASVQQLLQRYAIPAQSPVEPVLMQIDGIHQLQRYADLLRLLQNIESVRAVAVSDVNGQNMRLTIHTAGGIAVFKNLLALQSRLQPVAQPALAEGVVVDPAVAQILHYRLTE